MARVSYGMHQDNAIEEEACLDLWNKDSKEGITDYHTFNNTGQINRVEQSLSLTK